MRFSVNRFALTPSPSLAAQISPHPFLPKASLCLPGLCSLQARSPFSIPYWKETHTWFQRDRVLGWCLSIPGEGVHYTPSNNWWGPLWNGCLTLRMCGFPGKFVGTKGSTIFWNGKKVNTQELWLQHHLCTDMHSPKARGKFLPLSLSGDRVVSGRRNQIWSQWSNTTHHRIISECCLFM